MDGDTIAGIIILGLMLLIVPVSLGIYGLGTFIKSRVEAVDKKKAVQLEIQLSKEREARYNLKAIERQYGLPSIPED